MGSIPGSMSKTRDRLIPMFWLPTLMVLPRRLRGLSQARHILLIRRPVLCPARLLVRLWSRPPRQGGQIAAVALEVGSKTLHAYEGFSKASKLPIMPLINENNYGYWSSAAIQNTGGTATTVRVKYTPSAAAQPAMSSVISPPVSPSRSRCTHSSTPRARRIRPIRVIVPRSQRSLDPLWW